MMPQKYILFLFSLLLLFKFCLTQEDNGIRFVKNYQTAHLLEAGKTEITLTAGAVNDTIDIFNFKKKIASSEKVDLTQFNNFGDWQSYEAIMNFGFTKRFSGRFIYGFDLLEIGKSEAEVQHYGAEFKTLLVEQGRKMPAISLSFKFDTHIANNIRGDINSLTLNLEDIEIVKQFNPPATLTVGGLNDQNISIGLHFGKIFNENFMVYSFHKYLYTNVSSEFETSLEIGQFKKLQNDFSYHANTYNAGFGLYYSFNERWLLTTEYNFLLFQRKFKGASFHSNGENIAQTLDMAIHYFISNSWALSFGGKVDSSFLASEMPFTYNKKSATKFDNPYGQLYIAFTFGFDLIK